MNQSSPTSSAGGSRGTALVATTVLGPAALLLAACGQNAPTTEEIRNAYANHVRGDPLHEVGLDAKAPTVVIPNQEPRCSSDGNGHFDCRIRVIFEAKEANRSQRSQEQNIHIRRDAETWIIDSLN